MSREVNVPLKKQPFSIDFISSLRRNFRNMKGSFTDFQLSEPLYITGVVLNLSELEFVPVSDS